MVTVGRVCSLYENSNFEVFSDRWDLDLVRPFRDPINFFIGFPICRI